MDQEEGCSCLQVVVQRIPVPPQVHQRLKRKEVDITQCLFTQPHPDHYTGHHLPDNRHNTNTHSISPLCPVTTYTDRNNLKVTERYYSITSIFPLQIQQFYPNHSSFTISKTNICNSLNSQSVIIQQPEYTPSTNTTILPKITPHLQSASAHAKCNTNGTQTALSLPSHSLPKVSRQKQQWCGMKLRDLMLCVASKLPNMQMPQTVQPHGFL